MIASFADDTRIGSQIKCTSDGNALQRDLDSVYAWTETTNMQLNVYGMVQMVNFWIASTTSQTLEVPLMKRTQSVTLV